MSAKLYKRKRYPKNYLPKPGEFVPHAQRMQWQCCDCGLVHNVEFRIEMLGVRMYRNERATKAARLTKQRIPIQPKKRKRK